MSDDDSQEIAFLGSFKSDLYNLKKEIKVDIKDLGVKQ
jgi:hypothetical protein